MFELIIEVVKKLLISLLLVSFISLLFDKILTIGESPFQTIVVLTFYVYCIISLFTFSRHKLFYVLSLPVLTQFIHIFQKYSFTTGANSFWRLFPFILLDLYFIHFFFRKGNYLSQKSQFFISIWLIINAFFIIISPNAERILWGGIVLYLFTLPLAFSYLSYMIQADDFQYEIEKYLCLLFIILGLGTFGLVFAGAGYKGSDNLLATRNIADTNVTMAYFILLWPFVLLYTARNALSHLFKLAMLFLFTGVVILSFSRGAVLIVVPYLILTTLLTKEFLSFKWVLALLIPGVIYKSKITDFLETQDLTYFWKLRFGDMISLNSLLTKLESVSGRAEIHRIAYHLFLKSPLIGHGIGSFEILGPGYREAHSMWYTLLAEEGIIGTTYIYGVFSALIIFILKTQNDRFVLPISLLFYLIFNHTVGSTFVILPAKSITINCIAPIILLCFYFHTKSRDYNKLNHEKGGSPHL